MKSLTAVLIFICVATECQFIVKAATIRKKRAIFREQVSPHLGGKIPETAFDSDRLILNRFQREGIAIPDGIIIEPRKHDVHPYQDRGLRPTYQVKVASDGHYIAMPFADTTYIVPMPLDHDPLYAPVFAPVLTYLKLPSVIKKQPALTYITRPIGPQYPSSSLTYPSSSSYHLPSYGKPKPIKSYSSWSVAPPTHYAKWPGSNDYVSEQIYSDLDSFFHTFGPRVLRHTSSHEEKSKKVPKQ